MAFNKTTLVNDIMTRVEAEILDDLTDTMKATVSPKMRVLVGIIAEEVVDHIAANGEVSVSEAPGGSPLSPAGIGTIS